jgi:hypothetical protein
MISEKAKEVISNHPNYTANKEDVNMCDVFEYIDRCTGSRSRKVQIDGLEYEVINKVDEDDSISVEIELEIEESIRVKAKRVGEEPPFNWYFRKI